MDIPLNVGELFIKLGVNGEDKVSAALGNLTKGLGAAKSEGLAAKAAIVGLIYAVERLTASSGAKSQGLLNLQALTGFDLDFVQRFQWAANRMGSSKESIVQSLTGIQTAVAEMHLGSGMPKGLAMMAAEMGGINYSRLNGPNPTEYAAEFVRDFAKKSAGKDSARLGIANQYLRSLVGDDYISLSRQGALDPANLRRAQILSPHTLQGNARANKKWSDLHTQWENIIANQNGNYGPAFVNNVMAMSKSLEGLILVLEKLGTKLHIFETMGTMARMIANAFDDITSGLENLSIGKAWGKLGEILFQPLQPTEFGVAPDKNAQSDVPAWFNSIPSKVSGALNWIGDKSQAASEGPLNLNQTFHGYNQPKEVGYAAVQGLKTAWASSGRARIK